MTYQELCSFETLYLAYKEARKGKRKKQGTAQYEANALACTEKLSRVLSQKTYKPSRFEVFTVFEPKKGSFKPLHLWIKWCSMRSLTTSCMTLSVKVSYGIITQAISGREPTMD